jgi:predicted nucleotidyltransferase
MQTINIPNREKQVIFSFKKALEKSLGQNLISLQLFGSKARGDSQKDSDIDILLVIKEKNRRIDELIYNIVVDLMLKTGLYLSVKILDLKSFEKLNQIPTVFMQKIKEEAVKL